MKDGFELSPDFIGAFLLKNVFVIRQLKPIFAALKQGGVSAPNWGKGPFV
jgi:hypothetical protein